MIPALYLEKIQERKLPSKAEKLLAVNDEGTMLITFNNNFHNVLNIHEIQNEQIVSNKITFDEDLFLSRYFKYVDEQEIAPNTVKINSRNNEKHIFYVVNSEADKIVKVSVDAPLVG